MHANLFYLFYLHRAIEKTPYETVQKVGTFSVFLLTLCILESIIFLYNAYAILISIGQKHSANSRWPLCHHVILDLCMSYMSVRFCQKFLEVINPF